MSPRKDPPPELPRLVMQFFTSEFKEVDYVANLNGPFDASVPLQSKLQEALAKDCVVLIQVALIPFRKFYDLDGQGDESHEQPEPPTQTDE